MPLVSRVKKLGRRAALRANEAKKQLALARKAAQAAATSQDNDVTVTANQFPEETSTVPSSALSSQESCAHSSLKTSIPTAATSAIGSKTFFCLVCSKVTTLTLSSLVNNFTDKGNADFLAMFILKKMLDVPKENLEQFLSMFGHPHDWISVCHLCSPAVAEALEVQKKICELEIKLRRYQKELKGTIKKTYEENQLKYPSVDDSSIVMRSLHPVLITISTRRFIATGVRLTSKPTICIVDGQSVHVDPVPVSSLVVDPVPVSSPAVDPVPVSSPVVDPVVKEVKVNQSSDSFSESDLDDRWNGGDVINEGEPPVYSVAVKDKGKKRKKPPKKLVQNLVLSPPKKGYRPKKFKRDYKHADPDYSCALCQNLKPMPLHSFVKHLVFHNDRPYKCSYCNAYSTGNELELIKNAKDNQHGTHVCTKDTLVRVKLETDNIWKCGYCSSTFTLETQRDSHESEVHLEENSIPLPLNCSKCSSKYRDYHEWRIHRALEHPNLAKLGCFHCDEIFKLKTIEDADVEDAPARDTHIKKDHPLDFRATRLSHKYLFECRACGLNARKINEVQDHLEKEHGFNRKYVLLCPICFHTFKNKAGLKDHLHTCHQRRRLEKLVCELCAYEITAATPVKFLEHKFQKHGIEPGDGRQIYNCSNAECSFRCIRKIALEKHMMKEHNAERKYKCKVCGKGFLTNNHLHHHMEIHKNAENKPFQCEICGNSFAVRNYLYIHMRLSHQNRPFASTHKKKPLRRRKPTCNRQNIKNSTSLSTSLPQVECVDQSPSSTSPS